MSKARKRKEDRGAFPPGLKEAAFGLYSFLRAIVRDISDDALKIHASGLAYVTLVTIVPLLAISFSLLKGLGIHNQVEPFLESLLRPLGDKSGEVAGNIVAFIDNINVGVLGIVGIAVLIFAVLDMMRRIEAAFNDIWRVKRERTILQRVRDYLGVLFIAPLFMSLSVAMTEAMRNQSFLARTGIVIPDSLLNPAIGAVPYILFVLAFTGLYMFMPNTPVRVVPAALAGALVAVLWKIMGKIFSVFVVGAGSYAAIYSAFATLILLMVWIYLCWLIVLIGASVAYYLQNPSSQRVSRRFRALTARVWEKTALLTCGEIGRAFYAGEEPPATTALATRIGMPSIILTDILDALVAAGILATVRTRAFGGGYIPACPFDELTVGDMLMRLENSDEKTGVTAAEIKAPADVESLLAAAQAAARRELAKKTLKQISAEKA